MFIDNKKSSIGVKLKKRILILILIIAAIIFFSFKLFHEPILGITGIGYIIILSALVLTYHVWCFVRDYQYFNFTDQGQKLTFRYYSLSALFRQPHSVEIPKNEFVKAELRKKLLGLRQYVILFQQTQNGLAKYPPLSISLLKKQEKQDLINILTKHSNKNQ